MNIITTNPIIDEKDFIEDEYYSSLFGEAARRKREMRAASRRRKRASRKSGGFLNRLATGVGNVSRGVRDSGLLDTLGQVGQGGGSMPPPPMGTSGMGEMPPPMPMPITNQRQGMSTTTKVIIGVVVAGAVGAGIYFLMKSKKGAKKSTK